MANKIKKVVLAYSGGLDTSIIIPWLKENYDGCEVIAVAGNVGQGKELKGLEEKAIKTGASKLYIADLTDEFVDDYVFPTLKAGAVYEGKYLLGTSFARPVIAKKIVEIALKEGADAICHGCTGKGNDQVRFELTIKAFAPNMKIIAPWRIWDLKSRDEEIDYAEAHNVPLAISRETNYSKDKNLWHLSHEGLDLEDPANEPMYDKILELGVSPEKAPDKPTYVTISFEKGVPVAIDGVKMKGSDIVAKLNELGGANGIGIADIVRPPAARSSITPTRCWRRCASTRRRCISSSTSPSSSPTSSTTDNGSPRCARRCPRSSTALSRRSPATSNSSCTRATSSTPASPRPIRSMTRTSRPSPRTTSTIKRTARALSTCSVCRSKFRR